MMIAREILAVLTAYLLGAIPFAYIAGRLLKGFDIRRVGTHNAGAMNTREQIGVVPGIAVLILDMGKGSLAVFTAGWLGVSSIFIYLSGLAAVAGHVWPVFLGFKGGRGTATALGVLFTLAPREFAISMAIIVAIFILTQDTGLGVGIGLALLPLLLWIFGENTSLTIYSIVIALVLFLINFPMFKKDISQVGLKNYLLGKRLKGRR
jgi:acyl phosphate:glycerol-3-phosphate acyltransferase